MDAHSSGGPWLPRVTTPRFLRPGRLTGSGSARDWRVLALRRLAFVASLGVGVGLLGCALMLLRQPNAGELRAGWTRPWWPAPSPWPDDVEPQTLTVKAHGAERELVAHAAVAQTWDGGGP